MIGRVAEYAVDHAERANTNIIVGITILLAAAISGHLLGTLWDALKNGWMQNSFRE